MSAIRRLLAAACADRPISAGALAGLDPEQVRRHRLAPLAHVLGAPGFARDHLASSLLAERRGDDLEEAVAILGRAGVPVMLVKGAAYAGRHYADPATRPMSDIDLLVPVNAHREARRQLGRLGYWPAGDAIERTRFHHAITLKRRGGAVDLHRSIVHPLRAGGRLPGLWLRARRADHIPGAVVPDPADEALIGLAHIARHELMVPAINLVDGARLLARTSVPEVLEHARAVALERALATVIAVIDAARDPDAHLSFRLLPDVDDILAAVPPNRPLQLARKLALTGSPADAVRLALNRALEALTQ